MTDMTIYIFPCSIFNCRYYFEVAIYTIGSLNRKLKRKKTILQNHHRQEISNKKKHHSYDAVKLR